MNQKKSFIDGSKKGPLLIYQKMSPSDRSKSNFLMYQKN